MQGDEDLASFRPPFSSVLSSQKPLLAGKSKAKRIAADPRLEMNFRELPKVSVRGCGEDAKRSPRIALRCRRGWSSDQSARVELRSFNHCQERPDNQERLALSELLEKAGDGDFLRSVAEAVLQLLMEADVEGLIGAGRYERGGERRPGATATATGVRHTVGIAAAAHSEAASGELLPAVPGKAEGLGEGVDRGDPRGVVGDVRRGAWTSWCRRWV